MRLLNSTSLRIEEFTPSKAPTYAILSHTWGDSEASFNTWNSRLARLTKSRRPGFAKILSACRRARQDGLSYLWVDTVCIDKSSSAELSEAINSMFAWYENAKVCYVFLEDVRSDQPSQVDILDVFQRSRWFTRGWTLQELLAPDYILFFSRDWVELGTKRGLASAISLATGIDQLCLCKEKGLQEYSIAQRMSWAGLRSTTREEDVAYSLLGLFGINMPLLYGEGEKAFRRLQEEIIKVSDDHSIFAFDTLGSRDSLLADHPRHFLNFAHIQPRFEARLTPPFHFTNAGLSLSTPLIRTLSPFWVLAVLNCFEIDTNSGSRLLQICLPLLGRDNTYMRARDPISLVRRPLKDAKTEVQYELQSLTTSTASTYLVTYFTRVYPAFGAELDSAMKGFADNEVQKSAFMLTFPRGMANYRVVHAYPPEALHEDTSLFCPPVGTSGHPFSHGLLVFEEVLTDLSTSTTSSMTQTLGTGKRIGVYLAQTDDLEESNWMCRLIPNPDDDFYERSSELWPFEAVPDSWGHYDHVDHFIVSAHSQLAYHNRQRHVVLTEIAFDVQPI